MIIKKSDKEFSVIENKNSWTVSIAIDSVSMSYNVPKEICPTFDDLKSYVNECNLF